MKYAPETHFKSEPVRICLRHQVACVAPFGVTLIGVKKAFFEQLANYAIWRYAN
jgi:hypothetical protein